MKKFITDNIVWFLLAALAIAIVALVIARKNRKTLNSFPSHGATWTQEEKDKVMQVCDVQNSNTSPNND